MTKELKGIKFTSNASAKLSDKELVFIAWFNLTNGALEPSKSEVLQKLKLKGIKEVIIDIYNHPEIGEIYGAEFVYD